MIVDKEAQPESATSERPARPHQSLADVIEQLERIYPPSSAADWDAVGLVCGEPQAVVRRILFAIDPTHAVVEEAKEWGADLVVTHHPLLLRGVHGVPPTTAKGRVVHELIRSGIALYVAHTNADVAAPGVSDALARVIGLEDLAPLVSEPMTVSVALPPGADCSAMRCAPIGGFTRSFGIATSARVETEAGPGKTLFTINRIGEGFLPVSYSYG